MMPEQSLNFRPAWLPPLTKSARRLPAPSTPTMDPEAFLALSRNELKILFIIRDAMNSKTRQAWPSVKRIAELAGVSPRTVINVTGHLVDAGVLRKWRHGMKAFYSVPVLVTKRILGVSSGETGERQFLQVSPKESSFGIAEGCPPSAEIEDEE